jgi:threonyl-tRNA synthetase
MRRVYQDNGYQEVKGPQILDQGLWEKTGHWDKYRDNMFVTESEKRDYALKPMNCPGHILIYNQGLRSYKDLPLRFGEFGQCHRNEPSGGLHGIMRVRGFTQDDGHLFCTESQIQSEVADFHALVMKVYADFGFTDITVKLATRPAMRIGTEESWDKSENALRQAIIASGAPLEELSGEGAFYGPKIEYHLKDSLGRSWQCGTMQVDPNMPERLGAEYVDSDNSRKTPIMLHRAIVGSLERFIGMLTENCAGAFPAWLAPTQAVVCSISESSQPYAEQVAKGLKTQGYRAEADVRGEKITLKIREQSMKKVPFIAVVGDKEAEAGNVAVRGRGGVDLGVMSVADFYALLAKTVAEKTV